LNIGPDCFKIGSNKTKSHPKSGGTSSNPKPIELKFRLFKNLKGFEIMGAWGKNSNPIPSRNAGNIVTEMSRAEATEGDAMRVCFEAEA